MERGNVRADVNVSLRPTPRVAARHPHRDQERQLLPRRSSASVRYEISAPGRDPRPTAGRSSRRPGTGTRTRAPRPPGRVKSDAEDYRYFPEPDLVPIAPSREWVEEIRATLPEPPAARRRRLQAEWGYADADMRDVVNAGAVELIEATVDGGARPAAARKWWMGELARTANDAGRRARRPPGHARAGRRAAGARRLRSDQRQARAPGPRGRARRRGDPEEVVEARGLAVVSDDGPLLEAIDDVLAAQPDVVDKIRAGESGRSARSSARS